MMIGFLYGVLSGMSCGFILAGIAQWFGARRTLRLVAPPENRVSFQIEERSLNAAGMIAAIGQILIGLLVAGVMYDQRAASGRGVVILALAWVAATLTLGTFGACLGVRRQTTSYRLQSETREG